MKRILRPRHALVAILVVAGSIGCVGDTDTASNVTDTSAQLNAHCSSLSDSSSQSVTYFEYGTTTAYGMQTPHHQWSAGLCGPFSETIGDLAPNTTYHFRVCGRELSQNGIFPCGNDKTFTTLPADNTPVKLAWETLAASNKSHKPTSPVSALTVTGYGSGGPQRLLVAFVSWEGPASGHDTITVSGAGLTWTRAARAIGQTGNAEIWTARAAATISNATITATRSAGSYVGLLTVRAIRAASVVGGTGTTSGTTGPQSASVSVGAANSWLLAAGIDSDQAVARTVASGQAKVVESVVSGVGDFWNQRDATVPTGNQTIATTAPTGASRWNYAAVEVRVDLTPPSSCAITNLVDDQELMGNVPVTINAADDAGLSSVTLVSDSYTVLATATQSGSTWTATMGMSSWGDGPMTVTPVCSDGAGNTTIGSSVRIWVSTRRGSQMGLNIWTRGVVDTGTVRYFPDIDAVGATDVRWVRDGGWEWTWMNQTLAQYNAGTWSYLDGANEDGVSLQEVADYVHARGMRLVVTAVGSPSWVSGQTGSESLQFPVPLPANVNYYAGYVKALCARGADAVEVWNEPNLPTRWSPSAANPWNAQANWPRNYAKMLRAVYLAVKLDPATTHCQIIGGDLAAKDHEQRDPLNPVDYLLSLYTAKENTSDSTFTLSIAGFYDAISTHPYSDYHGDTSPEDWTHTWMPSGTTSGDPVYSHGVEQTWHVRNLMVFFGDGAKKIWGTEMGGPTYGPDATYDYGAHCGPGCGISEAEQATWVDEYVDAWMSTGAIPASRCVNGVCSSDTPPTYFGAYTGPLVYFALFDNPGAAGGAQEKHFGLLHDDDTAKPSYARFTLAADQLR